MERSIWFTFFGDPSYAAVLAKNIKPFTPENKVEFMTAGKVPQNQLTSFMSGLALADAEFVKPQNDRMSDHKIAPKQQKAPRAPSAKGNNTNKGYGQHKPGRPPRSTITDGCTRADGEGATGGTDVNHTASKRKRGRPRKKTETGADTGGDRKSTGDSENAIQGGAAAAYNSSDNEEDNDYPNVPNKDQGKRSCGKGSNRKSKKRIRKDDLKSVLDFSPTNVGYDEEEEEEEDGDDSDENDNGKDYCSNVEDIIANGDDAGAGFGAGGRLKRSSVRKSKSSSHQKKQKGVAKGKSRAEQAEEIARGVAGRYPAGSTPKTAARNVRGGAHVKGRGKGSALSKCVAGDNGSDDVVGDSSSSSGGDSAGDSEGSDTDSSSSATASHSSSDEEEAVS